MKKILAILLLLALTPVYGQDQQKIDSLLSLLKAVSEDTGKIKIYGDLCWLYASTREKTDVARQYADSIQMIGNKLRNSQITARAQFYYGVIHRHEGNYEKALRHLKEYVEYQEKTGNLYLEATGLYQIGTVHESMGNYDQSLAAYQRVKTIHEKNKYWYGVGFTLNGMGNIYRQMEKTDEAIRCYQQALSIFDSLHLQEDQAYVLENLGVTYDKMQDYQRALRYFNRAMKIDRELGVHYGVASDLEKIGIVYNKMNNHRQALDHLLNALSIRARLPQKDELADTKNQVGYTYLKLKDYTLAEQYLMEGLTLAQQIKAKPTIHTAYKYLTELYATKNDFRKAYEYLQLSHILKDSMLNQEKIRQLNELHTIYQTEQKEAQIAQQQSQIQQQRTQNRLILLGVAAFLLLILLGFQRFKQQQKFKLLEAKKIKELDQIKSNFFANISHEFRTPLTLIIGSLSKLMKQEQLSEEELHRDYQIMQKNSQRLLQLINQLLELSRLDAGKVQLHVSRIEIVSFLRRIFISFASMAEQKSIQLLFNGKALYTPSSEVHLFLYLDEDKMEKVFYNLFSNAVKFTPEAGKIAVQVLVGETGQQVDIIISNTGAGIPADKLPYIFDRFYQADDHSTRKYEGTGIGLALVKELVHLHHGSVRVVSVENDHTTFTITLLLGKEHFHKDEIVEKHAETQHSYENEPMLFPERPLEKEAEAIALVQESALEENCILIVEDHEELRQYIRENLPTGFQVLEAENGKKGLQAAIEHIPDLIVSDVMMPEMDGFELLHTLKHNEKTNHIPIIMLTARVSVEDKLEGLQFGADDYLIKPFHAEELQIRINNLIRQRKALREKFSRELRIKPNEVTVPSVQEIFLKKVQQTLEANISEENFGVEELSNTIGMSRVQLHRKLKALTNQSPSELIRNFRLQRAAELIKQDAGNMAEIAYLVGFNSQAYFTRSFQEYYHCSPLVYKKRIQKLQS